MPKLITDRIFIDLGIENLNSIGTSGIATAGADSLVFNVGKNAKDINRVFVKLWTNGTYEIIFFKQKKKDKDKEIVKTGIKPKELFKEIKKNISMTLSVDKNKKIH